MGFGGSGSSGSIATSLDVALNNTANNESLVFDGAIQKWSNRVVSGSAPVTSVAGKTGVVTLVKADAGLGNVDNTSDLAKPISTATQTALNTKADMSSVGAKLLLIDNAAALPAGTPAGVVVVVKA